MGHFLVVFYPIPPQYHLYLYLYLDLVHPPDSQREYLRKYLRKYLQKYLRKYLQKYLQKNLQILQQFDRLDLQQSDLPKTQLDHLPGHRLGDRVIVQQKVRRHVRPTNPQNVLHITQPVALLNVRLQGQPSGLPPCLPTDQPTDLLTHLLINRRKDQRVNRRTARPAG